MKSLFLLTILLFIILTGCGTTTPQIQTVDQYGVGNRNTIKITKDEAQDKLSVRFNLSMNRDKSVGALVEGHSKVNNDGIFEVKPVEGEVYFIERSGVNINEFNGNNFIWHLPELQTNFELEYNILNNVSIYGGGSYARSSDYDLFGYNFGLGFFREQNNWAIRFDIAGAVNDMIADAEYIRVEDKLLTNNTTRKVYFFEEFSKKKYLNMNLGLTINTRNSDWFVNGVLSYTLGWQNFYDIDTKPVTLSDFLQPDDLSYDDSYHSITFGLYKEIETLGKLIAGARFTKYTDLKGRLFIPDYFIQFDFDIF